MFLRNRFDVLRDFGEIDKRQWFWITQRIGKAIRVINTDYLEFIRSKTLPRMDEEANMDEDEGSGSVEV